MAIQDHAAFPGNARGVPSAGDGGPGYDSPEPSERLSASVGKDTAHGDVERWQHAKAAASGVKPGGSAGFGVGAADKLVQRTVTGDNNPDSNAQAGGKPVA